MTIDTLLLQQLSPISLEEMEGVKLMNRVDTKFVTTVDKISILLEATKDDYFIQQIGEGRNMPYYTFYYDTPDNDMYYQHVRGKKNRQKIRNRLYEGVMTNPFLEIKHKNNKGRTKKKRVIIEEGSQLEIYSEFIEENSFYNVENLTPKIENHFFRITLVNKAKTERITIDTDLHFHNFITDQEITLPQIGIIEWKRDGVSNKSGFLSLLRSLHIHESGFSKYCIGMALTDSNLRQNRLKSRLRLIAKIIAS